jgi:hypothetical protein
MAAQLAETPVSRWIAPVWPDGAYMQGLFREHPVGLFLLPALLARLGYPAEQAAYAVNALYQVLTLLVLARVAAAFAEAREARSLAWLLQLLPIAFAYRVRANHEQAVLLLFLLALLGTERARRSAAGIPIVVLSLMALLLTKGLVAFLALLACALWLFVGDVADRQKERTLAVWGLAAAGVAMIGTGAAYEALYRSSVGESFLGYYLGRWLGAEGLQQSDSVLAGKLYNLVWYAGRLLWFAFPWSLAMIVAVWRRRATVLEPVLGRDRSKASRDDRGLLFTLSAAALYLLAFSLSDRKAERYIFPSYFLVGACGAVAALRASPAFRNLVDRWERTQPYTAVLVWLLSLALHLVGGRLQLPRIKVWAP